mmetsp:Transcript_19089/g.38731  ORF Transcript_19089/g.38731 Transcript_19089/m.38731 type:complete len:82 (+) Transcript_19089:1-246(+)
MAWGLTLWFTHSEECDKFLTEEYWHLFFVFKMQVIFLLAEIALLGYTYSELQKRAEYAAVEEEEDDWTKAARPSAKEGKEP